MHTLSRQGDRHLSPNDLYLRGMAAHGLRGLRPDHTSGPSSCPNVGPEDVTHFFAPVGPQDPPILDEHNQMSYGIDWDEFDVTDIIEHHRDRHATDQMVPMSNPFLTLDPADCRSVVMVWSQHKTYRPRDSRNICVVVYVCWPLVVLFLLQLRAPRYSLI